MRERFVFLSKNYFSALVVFVLFHENYCATSKSKEHGMRDRYVALNRLFARSLSFKLEPSRTFKDRTGHSDFKLINGTIFSKSFIYNELQR